MSMFSTISEKISTPSIEVDIQNLEVSSEHWKSNKCIVKLAEEIELMLVGKPSFEVVQQELLKYFLSLVKNNVRIEELRFYTDGLNNLKVLIVSKIPVFKPDNILKRSINISLKKQNKTISLNDITTEEVEKAKSLIPETWKLDDALTAKFHKYKQIFL